MHDSFTALGGMIPLINIELGEIIVGGVGSGLYGMLLFVIISMFVAGLMVGRTPEYVGKKIEAKEVKMAMLAILVLPLDVSRLDRGGDAGAVRGRRHGTIPGRTASPRCCTPTCRKMAITDRRSPGLRANTPFYNLSGAVAMLVGRFWMIIPTMTIAGSLAAKKSIPRIRRHLPDNGRAVCRAAWWASSSLSAG